MKRPATVLLLLVAIAVTLAIAATAHGAPYSPDDHYAQVVADFHADVRAERVLTKAEVVRLVQMACYANSISGGEWAYLERVIPSITYRESRWDSKAANRSSTARGIAQFLAAWGKESKRLDPVWSIDRMVKVYADGGSPAIQRHWALTY